MALPDGLRRRRHRSREVALLTQVVADSSAREPREGAAGPFRLLAFDELCSTNDEAMARLRGGDPGGLFIAAARQTMGRGRQGRAWMSPPGNLYASLALRLDVAPSVAPQLGFIAGVALATTLRRRLGGAGKLRIKWPNDMVFAGAKLSGLLLESAALPDRRIGCVIGFGVNCHSHPTDLPYPATDLAACGDPAPEPSALLSDLANAMATQLAVWNNGVGFDRIRADWLSLAVEDGTALVVALPGRRLTGTFRGLDPTGRLLLDTVDGRAAIDAGDVFLPEIVDS